MQPETSEVYLLIRIIFVEGTKTMRTLYFIIDRGNLWGK